MTLQVDEVLQNRYRVISLLGEGGMGAVYRAWDTRLNVAVALKEMTTQPGLPPHILAQLRQQFQQEAQVLARLNHPHLVRIGDFFEEHGDAYLVMDFVEGESLAYRIEREGPLSEAQVLGWAGQLLDALAYCHSQGVIHRDIKPQNVIIRPDGRAVLVDFGLVKLWDPHDPRTRTAMRGMGTPEYAPPEQYDAHTGHTDARSDLYGLGATLYHALTGQAPPTATLRMADPEQFVPLQAIVPQVSGRTEAAVIKALELNRAQRWQSAAEMAQALELPVWAGKPAVEPAPPPLAGRGGTRAIAPEQALAPPVTKRRRVSGGALGGMVALGMLGVVVALAAVFGWFNIGGRVAATPAATRTPTSAPSLLSISPENASRVTQLARWGKGTVTQVAYSPDGRLLAVASSLGVYLYDAETLEEVRFIECDAWVYSVAFSPDGATLASGSGDGTVRLWGVGR